MEPARSPERFVIEATLGAGAMGTVHRARDRVHGTTVALKVLQRLDPGSLLRFVSLLMRRRRAAPELGWGTSPLIETADPAVFAHRCDWEGSSVVAVHNLGRRAAAFDLTLGDDATAVHDLLADAEEPVPPGGTLPVRLEGYGGRWLRVRR